VVVAKMAAVAVELLSQVVMLMESEDLELIVLYLDRL
jgi:hypothetical protein